MSRLSEGASVTFTGSARLCPGKDKDGQKVIVKDGFDKTLLFIPPNLLNDKKMNSPFKKWAKYLNSRCPV